MIKAGYTEVIKYKIIAECVTPLHIGSSEGDKGMILLHPVSRIPMLLGSSIAGAFREKASVIDPDHYTDWFGCVKGDQIYGSRITFSDGTFGKNKYQLEMRTRSKINKDTGTVASCGKDASGQLFDVEMVSSGAKFTFQIYVNCADEEERAAGQTLLRELLTRLQNGEILFGGQLSNGFGKISISKVTEAVYNMALPQREGNVLGRREWLKEGTAGETDGEVVTLQSAEHGKGRDYKIRCHIDLDHSVLVRANYIQVNKLEEATGKQITKEPDTMNLVNGKGEFIIPGSSIKGALRSRAESIAAYLHISQAVLDNAFGAEGQKSRSKIYVNDAVIKDPKASIRMRNRINKMTGGVQNGALFSDVPVSGKTEIEISVSSDARYSDWDRQTAEASVGLLIYALRDLGMGLTALGGTNSVGRGIVSVTGIEVSGEENEASETLSVLDTDLHHKPLISRCLKAVEEVG